MKPTLLNTIPRRDADNPQAILSQASKAAMRHDFTSFSALTGPLLTVTEIAKPPKGPRTLGYIGRMAIGRTEDVYFVSAVYQELVVPLQTGDGFDLWGPSALRAGEARLKADGGGMLELVVDGLWERHLLADYETLEASWKKLLQPAA